MVNQSQVTDMGLTGKCSLPSGPDSLPSTEILDQPIRDKENENFSQYYKLATDTAILHFC